MKIPLIFLVYLIFWVLSDVEANKVRTLRNIQDKVNTASRPISVHFHEKKNAGTRQHPKDFNPDQVVSGTTLPNGFSPAEVKSFYSFDTSIDAGKGHTIAVVVAYSNPKVESDLVYFSQKFKLPKPNILVVNQTGGSTLPATDATWATEVILDTQWAHAIAPSAKILVVCASTASINDLFTAVWYAAQHAKYVSISWGTAEFQSQSDFEVEFKKYVDKGVTFISSSGDFGATTHYPASSSYVISVGGTTINTDSHHNFVSETGWISSGGGCSQFTAPAPAQASYEGYKKISCAQVNKRAVPDTSCLANPNTGVLIYDSLNCNLTSPTSCWKVIGGTSLGAPITTARAVIFGGQFNANTVYSGLFPFRDITSGSSVGLNNNTYTATVGYDLVTGVGSPLGRFAVSSTAPAPTSTAIPIQTTEQPSPHPKCTVLKRGGIDKSIEYF